jgi:hypothetical protein
VQRIAERARLSRHRRNADQEVAGGHEEAAGRYRSAQARGAALGRMEAPPPRGQPTCLLRSLRESLKAVWGWQVGEVPGMAQDSCRSLLEALAGVPGLCRAYAAALLAGRESGGRTLAMLSASNRMNDPNAPAPVAPRKPAKNRRTGFAAGKSCCHLTPP